MISRKLLANCYRRFSAPWEALQYGIDRALRATLLPPRPDPNKILVVRLDGIGDYLVWLPCAEKLRELYPSPRFHVTLLTTRGTAPFAREFAWYDDLRAIDAGRLGRSPLYRRSVHALVRGGGFGVAIQPTYSRTYHGDAIVMASGAPERVGFDGDTCRMTSWMKRRADRFYTRLVPCPPDAGMELQKNAAFVRGLGATGVTVNRYRFTPEPARGEGPEGPGGPFFIIFPGAGALLRQYPPESWGEVARRVGELTGWRGVVCGGPGDAALAERVCRAAPTMPLRNLAGKASVKELIGLLARARLLVANETGVMHLAASVGTPAVSITGGGHYGRFIPYTEEDPSLPPAPLPVIHRMDCFGCDWECKYVLGWRGPAPCVAGITADDVIEAVKRLIDRRGD